MSLRLRLIVVFFLLSVVPLAAVTYYSYTSNVRAVRDAATRESDLLAGELSQRMQLVTAQLSERVEHLMDLQSMQASTAAARQTAAKPAADEARADEARRRGADRHRRQRGRAAQCRRPTWIRSTKRRSRRRSARRRCCSTTSSCAD